MKVEGLIFAATAAFFAVIAGVYWFWSYEDAGSTLLALTAAFGLLPAIYLLWASRRVRARPEDREDATPADSAGEVGTFPASSFWPLGLAAGAVLASLGLVFGIWFAIPGGLLMVLSATGAALESRGSS